MITKQINTIELHFDNPQECDDYQQIYEKKGYYIFSFGSCNDDYYFKGRKIDE